MPKFEFSLQIIYLYFFLFKKLRTPWIRPFRLQKWGLSFASLYNTPISFKYPSSSSSSRLPIPFCKKFHLQWPFPFNGLLHIQHSHSSLPLPILLSPLFSCHLRSSNSFPPFSQSLPFQQWLSKDSSQRRLRCPHRTHCLFSLCFIHSHPSPFPKQNPTSPRTPNLFPQNRRRFSSISSFEPNPSLGFEFQPKWEMLQGASRKWVHRGGEEARTHSMWKDGGAATDAAADGGAGCSETSECDEFKGLHWWNGKLLLGLWLFAYWVSWGCNEESERESIRTQMGSSASNCCWDC